MSFFKEGSLRNRFFLIYWVDGSIMVRSAWVMGYFFYKVLVCSGLFSWRVLVWIYVSDFLEWFWYILSYFTECSGSYFFRLEEDQTLISFFNKKRSSRKSLFLYDKLYLDMHINNLTCTEQSDMHSNNMRCTATIWHAQK